MTPLVIVVLCVLAILTLVIVIVSRKDLTDYIRFWLGIEPLDDHKSHIVIVVMSGSLLMQTLMNMYYTVLASILPVLPQDFINEIAARSLQEIFLICVKVAVIEEFWFRFIPLIVAFCVKKFFHKDIYIFMGIVSSVIFGLAHVFNYDNPSWKLLPYILPQIMLGFWFYYLAKRYSWYGIFLSVAVHFAIDMNALTIMHIRGF